ncbi:hypothetical protein TRFO_40865 [Tritrichomonas foetus]|uniref:Uncharacterized protein n=1 Tax=Tritrichomonas foetus TaxID=1144522 RepID=A0A1J4IZI3_9EUKA|nr:hypothetical protein TRFO_40865 [Tritrichomonas foetus]|eukprot:OHS92822.1 hypothetical protein TRFO_40865 [Tritrichomonas foetus]
MTSKEIKVIDADKFEQCFWKQILPSFAALREFKFMIPPWTEESFWDNIKNLDYAKSYVEECFDYIIGNIPPKGTEISPTITSILLSVLHIAITYYRKLPEGTWKDKSAQLLNCQNPQITKIIEFIIPFFEQPTENIQDFFHHILKASCSELLPACFFHYISLIHRLKTSETMQWMFYPNLSAYLLNSHGPRVITVLFHIFYVAITALPGMATSKISVMLDPIKEKIGNSEPISSMSYELYNLAKKEMEYPGYSYYTMLKWISNISPSNGNTVTIFYDQNFRYFPNMMYNREPTKLSIAKSFIDFVSFYLATKLHVSFDKLSIHELLEIFKMIKFTEESDQKIMKKFKLTKVDNNNDLEEGQHQIFKPLPPEIPLSIVKIPLTFELTPELLTPYDDSFFLYSCVMQRVFNNSVVQPIEKYMESNPERLFFEQQIFIAGNDFFQNTILLMHFLSLTNSTAFKKACITYYLYPLSSEGPSTMMSNFLGVIDPIYSRYAKDVYHLITNISPTYDENSPVGFATVLEKDPIFLSHTWFTNPSPSAMLQFSIQHFLLYARKRINVYVWKCIISQKEKEIIIPFISSLQIGTNNTSNGKNGQSKNPDANLQAFDIESTLINGEIITEEKVKTSTISLWNVNTDLNVDPRDDTLLREYFYGGSPSKNKAESPKQYDREIITRITILSNKDSPFSITIDGREYGPTKKLEVSRMEDPNDKTQHMTLRIACFSTSLAKNKKDLHIST